MAHIIRYFLSGKAMIHYYPSSPEGTPSDAFGPASGARWDGRLAGISELAWQRLRWQSQLPLRRHLDTQGPKAQMKTLGQGPKVSFCENYSDPHPANNSLSEGSNWPHMAF